MNRQHRRPSGAPGVMLLSAGLAVVCGPSGWATEARAGELLPVSQSWPRDRYAQPPWLTDSASQHDAVPLERAETGSYARSHGADESASAAPPVEVRVGDHGEFERVAFEWPEPIEFDVVRHADQVTVEFGRPGRIDLSRVAAGLARVVDAWAEYGDRTTRVTLRVLPTARVRSFNLGDGRVAIDLLGGTAAPSLASSPAPEPKHDTVEALRQAIVQRDAVIEDLLARFEQLAARFERLERTVTMSSGDLDRVTAGHAGPMPRVGDTSRPQPRSPSHAAVEAPSGEPPAPLNQPAAPERAPATAGQGRQGPESTATGERRQTAQAEMPAPGQVEIDEEAVERALDFTLVQEGALLLPVGRAEFTPSFTYTRRTGDFPVVVNGLLGEEEVKRNEFEFLASLLVGLPFDTQLELGLPYNLVEQDVVDSVGGIEVEESSDTGHGLGDFSVGLAKTVLRERKWLPDVVLRVNWDTGTGERDDNDVALDGGFQELTGSVSLAKRQDPLVFVAGASYEAAFDKDGIDPGDALGFSLGTFLAASPNTSLRVVLNQSFVDAFKVDGQSVDGSDQVQSVLSFGASAILGRNMLVDGAVGVGLTDDSPDYAVSLSLPIRFSTPGL